jgi:hypothetical protein
VTATRSLTAKLPDRLRAGLMLGSVLVLVLGLLIALGRSVPGLMVLAWFGEIFGLLTCLVFIFIVLQVVAFRNPAIELTDDALVYYGVTIPWPAISGAYLGTANLTMIARGEEGATSAQEQVWIEIKDRNGLRVPAPSRRLIHYFARLTLRVSAGNLPLPLVNECSAQELDREIRQRIRT